MLTGAFQAKRNGRRLLWKTKKTLIEKEKQNEPELKRIVIESINNEPATESEYTPAFKAVFTAHDEGTEFVLYR